MAKNIDYVIYVSTKRRTWTYRKEDKGWTQTGPNGRVRQLSAEQLLSHLLPPVAGDQPSLRVRVERRTPIRGPAVAKAIAWQAEGEGTSQTTKLKRN